MRNAPSYMCHMRVQAQISLARAVVETVKPDPAQPKSEFSARRAEVFFFLGGALRVCVFFPSGRGRGGRGGELSAHRSAARSCHNSQAAVQQPVQNTGQK